MSNRIPSIYFKDDQAGNVACQSKAMELLASGERVMVSRATNSGWHSRMTYLAIRFGPKVRNPMTAAEISVVASPDACRREQDYKADLFEMMTRGAW